MSRRTSRRRLARGGTRRERCASRDTSCRHQQQVLQHYEVRQPRALICACREACERLPRDVQESRRGARVTLFFVQVMKRHFSQRRALAMRPRTTPMAHHAHLHVGSVRGSRRRHAAHECTRGEAGSQQCVCAADVTAARVLRRVRHDARRELRARRALLPRMRPSQSARRLPPPPARYARARERSDIARVTA